MKRHCLSSAGKTALLACLSEQQQFRAEAGLFQLEVREQEARVCLPEEKLGPGAADKSSKWI